VPELQCYDRRTIRLHWLTALLVLSLWCLAQVIDYFPAGLPRISIRSTHILLGAALVFILVRRIHWRLGSGRRLPLASPAALGTLALAVHWLLYAALCSALLLGLANAWKRGDSIYGLFSIPKLLPADQQLKKVIEHWHKYAANALMLLALLHALAGLMHHFVLRDGILRRMLARGAAPDQMLGGSQPRKHQQP
jgi:cytochrome b561